MDELEAFAQFNNLRILHQEARVPLSVLMPQIASQRLRDASRMDDRLKAYESQTDILRKMEAIDARLQRAYRALQMLMATWNQLREGYNAHDAVHMSERKTLERKIVDQHLMINKIQMEKNDPLRDLETLKAKLSSDSKRERTEIHLSDMARRTPTAFDELFHGLLRQLKKSELLVMLAEVTVPPSVSLVLYGKNEETRNVRPYLCCCEQDYCALQKQAKDILFAAMPIRRLS